MTQDVINKLREYGGYSKNGKMSDETVVPKRTPKSSRRPIRNVYHVREQNYAP